MPELNSFHLDTREGIKKRVWWWSGGVLDTTHSISQPLGSNCFLLGHCIRNDFPPSEGVVFLGVTY